MRMTIRAILLVAPLWGGACVVAAAGAGAGAGIYLTSRGVESLVETPLDGLVTRTQKAFTDFGIRPVGEKIDHEGGKREFQGKTDDLDVTVKLEQRSATTTKVEVTVRRNMAEWDKSYAQQLLARITAP